MNHACFCGREARGFLFKLRHIDPIHTCSMSCLDIAHARTGDMTMTNDEYNSIMAASPVAGAFLERLGKTDLAQMTQEEWLDFLAHTYAAICAENRRKWDVPGGVPF